MVETLPPWSNDFERFARDRNPEAYKPHIVILGHGGTIAMAPNEEGVLVPAQSVEQLVAQVPKLAESANLTLRQLVNKDSTNLTPKDWRRLARNIDDFQSSLTCDGIIVTHGTDTMAHSASAVALALGRGLRVPVVFTGAQNTFGELGSDAGRNLENAARTVIAANAAGVAEVMITFADRVMRGARAVKVSERDYQAFDTPGFPHLGKITATGIEFSPVTFKNRRNGSYEPQHRVFDYNDYVLTIDVVPGLRPDLLLHILTHSKCRGLILRSLGGGNVPAEGPYSLLPVIKEARRRRIPVVVTTKFAGGTTQMEVYEPGKKALDMGAIPSGDMTDVMTQVKLMWLLSHEQRYIPFSLSELRDRMATDFVGEISTKRS